MNLTRQANIVPETIVSKPTTVIGVGAVGRQVAIQLACMGCQELQLIDFDKVDDSNISSQGYYNRDIGKYKVTAIKSILKSINPDISLTITNSPWRPSVDINSIVFCCVDKISTRVNIWHFIKSKIELLIDSRMSGESLRLLAATQNDSNYDKSFFSQEEAVRQGCTSQTTIYAANIMAGLMLHQYTRYLRGFELNRDLVLGLLSM